MSTDEKYLDDLLKSMTEGDTKPRTMEDTMKELTAKSTDDSYFSGSTEAMMDDLFDRIEEKGLLGENGLLSEEPLEESSVLLNDEHEEESNQNIDASPALKEDSSALAEEESEDEWKSSLDDLIAQVNLDMSNEAASTESKSADIPITTENMDNQDFSDLMSGLGNVDEDLEEISGLLDKPKRNKAVDNDMLALLESIDEKEDQDEAAEGGFAQFEDETSAKAEEEPPAVEPDEIKEKPKKKRDKKDKTKKKFGLFGKKKNKDEAASPAEGNMDDMLAQLENLNSQQANEISGDIAITEQPDEKPQDNEQALDGEEGGADKPAKKKKAGFFSKLLTALTEEEDEAPSGKVENISAENEEILNELEQEDQKEKKEKKKKKDKKSGKKKGKDKAKANNGDDDQEDEDTGEDKKKKKKVKESRKEKKAKNEVKEKPVKVLSRKNLLLLIASCATLLACVLILSTFLPEYADKRAARNAFYEGDYEEAYELLYDKHLNSSDKLIFNRARTVLRLERKLESYENNLSMDRKLEAVDALLGGIRCYQDLTDADEYGARSEVDALYQQICGILESNYGISEEEALEINAYDNETYTRKLYSVVFGTDFVRPGEEKAAPTPSVPQDVLPEEEEIISD